MARATRRRKDLDVDRVREAIDPAVWRETASRIAAAFGRGQGTAGLVAGIEHLARALGGPYPHERGDVNELPEQPHLGGAS